MRPDNTQPDSATPGRLRPAPEHFLTPQGIRGLAEQSEPGRRAFVRRAFGAAAAGLAVNERSSHSQIRYRRKAVTRTF